MSAGKIITTVFWNRKGVLLVFRKTTINFGTYCEILKKLRRVIQNRRKGKLAKGIRLNHDNARPHVSQKTKDVIDQFGWDLVSHPPYSPNLALKDFHLFSKLNLGGQRFETGGELQDAVTKFVNGLTADFFEVDFQK